MFITIECEMFCVSDVSLSLLHFRHDTQGLIIKPNAQIWLIVIIIVHCKTSCIIHDFVNVENNYSQLQKSTYTNTTSYYEIILLPKIHNVTK